MAEDDADRVVHAPDRDGRRTRHAEPIIVRVVGPRVDTINQCLAGVLILEFQIRAGERHPTHVECGVYRQIQ